MTTFTPRPIYTTLQPWKGRWVGPRVSLDDYARENLSSSPGIEARFLGSPSCCTVTTLTQLLRFQFVPEAAISILRKLRSRNIGLNDATTQIIVVKLYLNTSRLTQTRTAHQHVLHPSTQPPFVTFSLQINVWDFGSKVTPMQVRFRTMPAVLLRFYRRSESVTSFKRNSPLPIPKLMKIC